ncbi:MAG TPA: hypothetical protein VLG40_03655 [Candidatus Saccharimonas sp.]|nr:hypothetical protein [Candidatus Saccharimonas sp.]
MSATEFPIDLDDPRGIEGPVVITDSTLIIRPAVPGQYPHHAQHDTLRVTRLFDMANAMQGYPEWYIFCPLDPQAAHELLDNVFRIYVDMSCYTQWCDARVLYIVDGETVKREEYGFDDGQYTMVFHVYCGAINDKQVEELLGKLATRQQTDYMDYIVMRPDESAKDGVNVRGYAFEMPDMGEGDLDDTLLPQDEVPLDEPVRSEANTFADLRRTMGVTE